MPNPEGDLDPKKIAEMNELGSVVRSARKALGLRQAELAGLSGVGVRFLSELERGKPTCATGRVLRVLARLGLEVWLKPRGAGEVR